MTGSKTLIKDLKKDKATWQARANEALWRAVVTGTLSDGWSVAADDAGLRWRSHWVEGRNEVDTVFPVW